MLRTQFSDFCQLRKIFEFYFKAKNNYFFWELTLTLIYFSYGTTISSDNQVHKILWTQEFRKTNTF
jgi:hypothetical protein